MNPSAQEVFWADFLFLDMGFSFPKEEKLKSKKLIDEVFTAGVALKHFPLKLLYIKHDSSITAPIQAGFAVPKKNFTRAVDRNRVKRLLREAYRLNKQTVFNNIEGQYALMILYLGKELPDYHVIEKKMVAALNSFSKKITDEKRS